MFREVLDLLLTILAIATLIVVVSALSDGVTINGKHYRISIDDEKGVVIEP